MASDEEVRRLRIILLRKWERDPSELDGLVRKMLHRIVPERGDDCWEGHGKGRLFRPLTDEEAAVAYKAAEPAPLSSVRIEEMVRFATGGVKSR